jgi:hypothetical protein
MDLFAGSLTRRRRTMRGRMLKLGEDGWYEEEER